jgi:GT2 family glycosyltransferase
VSYVFPSLVGAGEPGLASVVVPNYNGALYLGDCLDSVRSQTYEPLEAIVVDDGSTDGSADIADSRFPESRLIRLPRNGGFAYAANQGMKAARGEFIALLNNDAVADPDWIAQLVAALSRHPEAGSAASKILLLNKPDRLNSAGDLFRRSGVPDNRGAWERDHGQYDEEVEVFGASGAALAYRRVMLADLGLFDERFFMYCEDVDLAFRGQLAGYRCIYAPRAIVRHRLSASGGGRLASYYCGRNFIWLLARDLPAAAWRRHWPAIIATQLMLAFHSLLHAREPAARARLDGQWAGLRGAPRFRNDGPDIARQQRVPDSYLLDLLA